MRQVVAVEADTPAADIGNFEEAMRHRAAFNEPPFFCDLATIGV